MAAVLCLVVAVIAGYGISYASSGYLTQFNTRYGTAGTALDTCSVCHTNTPARNYYGSAFGSNSHDYATIEPLDSDGDGYSNITEINAGTFPGNASSVPATTDTTLPPVTAPSGGTHSSEVWTGTQQCLQCHTKQANEVHGSVHYQWQGEAPYNISGPAIQGKLNTAINSYCVNILGNWNVCGNCHAGLGAKPEAAATGAQLANIDCLVCHQKDYKRKKVNGVFVPDTANMTITMDQAVQTVHKPGRANCLQCHAKAGGGDNNKRGDIALAHVNTTDRNFDVHMATTGGNLTCQSCHVTQNHRIAGRGSDLRETDLDVAVTCTSCHTNKLSPTGHTTADVNRHVNKVACQTCHIKAYARNASDTAASESTEVDRDWTKSEWSAANNRWEPSISRGSNLKPVYAFWNGYSYNHNMGETAVMDPATGRYPTSRPEGGINDAQSKLFPFKYKTALQPFATSLSKLIALDTGVFMSTGDIDAAVEQGLINMGLNSSQPYSFVETDTYQLITHEAMPSSQSLTCNACHGSAATQMNLQDMGYALKGPASSVCSQCHGYESNPGFTSVHNEHVREEGIDCSRCHNFTRASTPTEPPSSTTYALSVTKSGTGSGTVISSPAGISCGSDCSQSYSANAQVTLSATAASGSTFAGWSGNSDCSDGTVTMNASKSCTATFNAQQSSSGPDIVAPSSFSFGSVNVGSSTTRSISIQNSGTATLRVSRVTVSGTNASMFRALSTHFSISRSGSYNLRVRFTPGSSGSKTATLNIYSNDPDTPVKSITLTGSSGRSSHDDDDD